MIVQKNKSEIETELKIKLSPKDMEKVLQKLIKEKGESEVFHKFTPRMYYDTPDFLLHKNGISLRVQYNPGKNGHLGEHEQTLKLESTSDAPPVSGVLRRKECHSKLKNHQPDLQSITDREAIKVLAPLKCKKPVHIFTAAIERRFFDLKLQCGKNHGIVEMAFDSGYLVLSDNSAYQNFSEIEVELKNGRTNFIEIVRDKIIRIASSAKVQTLSKAKQGIHLQWRHNGQNELLNHRQSMSEAADTTESLFNKAAVI
ncbi:MAG: CYTH domain-containing protein [Alphaproteobacteria bacterium]|nr:CYTH domain-containing protein [Alphaproteobacteria bacterium]